LTWTGLPAAVIESPAAGVNGPAIRGTRGS
jgi:hypothetical protein